MGEKKENNDEKERKKQERIKNFKKNHPRGTCLLARDNPHNRGLFPEGPFGDEDIAESICPSPDKCPHYNYLEDRTAPGSEEAPIHMLIASYRDRLCGRTLHNAFKHAKNPKRLIIRVIEQTMNDSNLEDDAGCFERYCDKYNPNCQEYKDQVRIIPVNANDSKGPTWARSRLSAMIHWDYLHRNSPSDELDFQPVQMQDFCMQTDSHMDFSDNWDVELIDMFHLTQNDYAVLSTYVTDIEANNKDPTNVPHLCMVQFTSSIRNWGTKECNHLLKPKLTNAMWGAGLSFHRCHAELNVPVDPYLDNVFDGEEGSRGIRFFTHGYDVYTPHRVLVTHDYHGHQSNPVVHTWGGKGKNKVSHESKWKWFGEIESHRSKLSTFGSPRVNMMIGIGKEPKMKDEEIETIRRSRFGIGNKRTLDQAIEFTGINLPEKKMVVNRCGNVNWVPFEESSDYGVDETLSRGNVGGKLEKSSIKKPFAPITNMFEVNGGSPSASSGRKEIMNSESTSFTQNNNVLIVIVLVAVVAVVVRLSTGKRRKDDMYKK